jgi:hypothetical protein
MAKTNDKFSVILLQGSDQMTRLLKQAESMSGANFRTVMVRNDKELVQTVEKISNCCIVGDLAANWNSNGSLFKGFTTPAFYWPPTYVLSNTMPSEQGMRLLFEKGILWCFQAGKLGVPADLVTILSGQAWTTNYGYVFQKISSQTIKTGDLLAIIVNEDGGHGKILFKDGNVIAAKYEKETGVDALYRIALLPNCRIDLHKLFLKVMPSHMKESLMIVIRQLVERADENKVNLAIGRPPGMTRMFTAKMLDGLRQEFSDVIANAWSGSETPAKAAEAEAEAPQQSQSSTQKDKDPSSSAKAPLDQQRPSTSNKNELSNLTNNQKSSNKRSRFIPIDPKQVDTFSVSETAVIQEERITIPSVKTTAKHNDGEKMSLPDFISAIPGSKGGVTLSSDGACLFTEGEVDFETIVVVASMAFEHFDNLAKAFSIENLSVAAFSGKSSTFFVKFSDDISISYGSLLKNSGTIAKKVVALPS